MDIKHKKELFKKLVFFFYFNVDIKSQHYSLTKKVKNKLTRKKQEDRIDAPLNHFFGVLYVYSIPRPSFGKPNF